MNAGSATVSPGDGDFLHFEFKFSAQEESLGIESPALDLLQRKDRLHCRLSKSFEAALRVLELQAERDAQQQVENPAEDLAVQRLALRLGFGAQPARPDGDIGAFLERLEKLGSFFDGRGQVGVAE